MDTYITRLFLYSVSFVLIISVLLILSDYFRHIASWTGNLLKALKLKYKKSGVDMNRACQTPNCSSSPLGHTHCIIPKAQGCFQSNPQQTITTSSNSSYTWTGIDRGIQDYSAVFQPSIATLKAASKAKGSLRLQQERERAKLISRLVSLEIYVNKARKCCSSVRNSNTQKYGNGMWLLSATLENLENMLFMYATHLA